MKRSWTSWHGSRASYAGIWVTRFGEGGVSRRVAATASCVKAMARIAQITAGRDAAQTALTAGALKPSAVRLLRHSTSAEVYHD
jgi:hypothetical protein